MNIMACVFKRTKRGKVEAGIIIDEGDGPIIDSNGKVVNAIWSWDGRPYMFCVNVNFKTQKTKFKPGSFETVLEI